MPSNDPREAELAAVLGDVVGAWPEVRARGMFGHRGFAVEGRMFAFVSDGRVVILKMRAADRAALAETHGGGVFPAHHGPIESWIAVPIGDPEEIASLARWLNLAYERAVAEAAERAAVAREERASRER